MTPWAKWSTLDTLVCPRCSPKVDLFPAVAGGISNMTIYNGDERRPFTIGENAKNHGIYEQAG